MGETKGRDCGDVQEDDGGGVADKCRRLRRHNGGAGEALASNYVPFRWL